MELSKVALISLLLFLMGWMILSAIGLIDSFTQREIGIKEVPCIDKEGNPFQDELCNETIHCTTLGLVAEVKCSEITLEEIENE